MPIADWGRLLPFGTNFLRAKLPALVALTPPAEDTPLMSD